MAYPTSPSANALLFSTFLGGSHTEDAWDVATDRDGFVYVVGNTWADDFPVTPGAFAISRAGISDMFIAKLTPDGISLVFATYLGGTETDEAWTVEVDDSGRVYIGGTTTSADFPTTPDAYDSTFNGGFRDAFVAILSSDGTQLLYSTYVGGSGEEQTAQLAFDVAGSMYLATTTWSTDFPTTSGSWDPNPNGHSDVTVTKLDRTQTGTSLVFSTFLGGSLSDGINGLHLDANGVHLAGTTLSGDFPTTVGAYDETFNGGFSDAFVAVLDPGGSTLLSSSFIGGGDEEQGRAISKGADGRIVVAGRTQSTDFPTTPEAIESVRGQTDAFVTVLASGGASLHSSVVLGGSRLEEAWSVGTDGAGFVYLAGGSYSDDFPTTQAAFQSHFRGMLGFHGDAFLLKMDPSGSALVYSTYLGGQGNEWGVALDLAVDGTVTMSGSVSSSDFPVTPGAFDTALAFTDAFVAKFNLSSFANTPPSLTWMGTESYADRGVDPLDGSDDRTFTYRVSYSDGEGDAPGVGSPAVHILRFDAMGRWEEILGSPFAMDETDPLDTTFTGDKGYEYSTRLDGSDDPTDYFYVFSAVDSAGSVANDFPVRWRGPGFGPRVWYTPQALRLVPYEHTAGFRVPVPEGWTRVEDAVLENETIELQLLGPTYRGVTTNIVVDTGADASVRETPSYLKGLADATVQELERRTGVDFEVTSGPLLRTLAGHSAVSFTLCQSPCVISQKIAIIVSEAHARFWLLVLTSHDSTHAVMDDGFERMLAGFEITLPPLSSSGLNWLAVGGILGALGIVVFLILVVLASRRGRRLSTRPPEPPGGDAWRSTPSRCATCGAVTREADLFCGQCGRALRAATASRSPFPDRPPDPPGGP